jgi:hypothetical protein
MSILWDEARAQFDHLEIDHIIPKKLGGKTHIQTCYKSIAPLLPREYANTANENLKNVLDFEEFLQEPDTLAARRGLTSGK